MKSALRITIAASLLPLAGMPPSASAQDPQVDRLLASQCAQCHGTEGRAVGDMDGLTGDEDLFEDLVDMIGEDHIEDIMEHQAHGYTVEQMRRIAAYYAGLPEPGGEDEDGTPE